MKVYQLANNINNTIKSSKDISELVSLVRETVAEAVVDQVFIRECVDYTLRNVDNFMITGNYSPLYVDSKNNWRMALFLWNPKSENEPHQHNTWSVSGVVHNQLEVKLFDKKDGNVIEKSVLHAQEGQTGYLIPPCIHALRNPSEKNFTVTLHVFCDSELIEQRNYDTIWFGENDPRINPNPKSRVVRDLMSCLLLIGKLATAIQFPLLEKVFFLGNVSVKLAVYKRMVVLDLNNSKSFGIQLENLLTGLDKVRFNQTNSRLFGA
ncbi:hypothetical protein I5523_08180 [Acinetobacter oleivorans]|uniref:hypothetical protein n=1 Tax=Acinetobacter oleivorans TaxID=1148157 RepID=UPI0018FF2A9F|nr:hypothetical protein [Acinetobacter oleivorans]MBJ9739618.1 hypothetical protein [Acinetobacter oleivorans]MCU4411980.1 hypothetical protein [Acinetobacter oleivorans]